MLSGFELYPRWVPLSNGKQNRQSAYRVEIAINCAISSFFL